MKIKIKEVKDRISFNNSYSSDSYSSCDECILYKTKTCENFQCNEDTHFEFAEEYDFELIEEVE